MPIGRTSRTNALTRRMVQVVGLLAEGLDPPAIARELGISEATVDTHLADAKARLQARNRAHLVHLAYVAGLLVPPVSDEPEPVRTYFLSLIDRDAKDDGAALIRSWGHAVVLRRQLALAFPQVAMGQRYEINLLGQDSLGYNTDRILVGTYAGEDLAAALTDAGWPVPERRE